MYALRVVADPTLPPDLLRAAAACNGSVALVLGAGCSAEQPTSLPLSGPLAVEAERRLVADGVLERGECADPADLSSVSDTVFKKFESQEQVVLRLPRDRMANAQPNEGTLLAAAMLREHAVACVLTLNYDMSIVSALSRLGATDDVAILAGPEEHKRLGIANVIFLHRNVYAKPDDWIMRPEQLKAEWRDSWEHVVAARFLSGPITVFAGLGSPAAVLTETMLWIMAALRSAGIRPILADPGAFKDSQFASNLGLTEMEYVKEGWCGFMSSLATRVVGEQVANLESTCASFLKTEGFPAEDVGDLMARLAMMDLLKAGQLRASWALAPTEYLPIAAIDLNLFADLVTVIRSIERRTNTTAQLSESGVVGFESESGTSFVAFATGRGTRRWSTVETELMHRLRQSALPGSAAARTRFAVVAAVPGGSPSVAPPPDIVGTYDQGNVAAGLAPLEIVDVDAARSDDVLVRQLVS